MGYNKKVCISLQTDTLWHIFKPFGIVASWVTASLVVSALIKSNVTKCSACMNVNLSVIGEDILNICLKRFNRRPEVAPLISCSNNSLSFGLNFGWTYQNNLPAISTLSWTYTRKQMKSFCWFNLAFTELMHRSNKKLFRSIFTLSAIKQSPEMWINLSVVVFQWGTVSLSNLSTFSTFLRCGCIAAAHKRWNWVRPDMSISMTSIQWDVIQCPVQPARLARAHVQMPQGCVYV